MDRLPLIKTNGHVAGFDDQFFNMANFPTLADRPTFPRKAERGDANRLALDAEDRDLCLTPVDVQLALPLIAKATAWAECGGLTRPACHGDARERHEPTDGKPANHFRTIRRTQQVLERFHLGSLFNKTNELSGYLRASSTTATNLKIKHEAASEDYELAVVGRRAHQPALGDVTENQVVLDFRIRRPVPIQSGGDHIADTATNVAVGEV